tara:strand:- start:1921 stop:2130 length:210 start_codon:yes stop_codon:yes gene_type:complete
MSKSVIFLSFDDHQTYEVNGTQAAFQVMDEQQQLLIKLVGCRATNDDDFESIQAYRTLLLTTFGGDTHE